MYVSPSLPLTHSQTEWDADRKAWEVITVLELGVEYLEELYERKCEAEEIMEEAQECERMLNSIAALRVV